MRIQYIIITCLLLFLSGNHLMAQGREFGIRAGVLGAQTYNRGDMVEGGLNSLYGGLFVGRPLGSTFFISFISGVDYFQNGYRADDQNYRKLHYVGVPAAVRFHFGPFHLQPGVSFNLKVAERLVVDGEEVLNGGTSSYWSDTKSSWFDLPIMLGAGVRLMDVIVETRIYLGWMDINQGNKNIHLQLGLAYSF
jgi:hypothetical protein